MHVIYERRKNVMWLNNNNKNPQSLDQTYSFIPLIPLICTSMFLYSVNFSSHSLWCRRRHPIIQPKGINSWNNTCSISLVVTLVCKSGKKTSIKCVCVLTFDDNTILCVRMDEWITIKHKCTTKKSRQWKHFFIVRANSSRNVLCVECIFLYETILPNGRN